MILQTNTYFLFSFWRWSWSKNNWVPFLNLPPRDTLRVLLLCSSPREFIKLYAHLCPLHGVAETCYTGRAPINSICFTRCVFCAIFPDASRPTLVKRACISSNCVYVFVLELTLVSHKNAYTPAISLQTLRETSCAAQKNITKHCSLMQIAGKQLSDKFVLVPYYYNYLVVSCAAEVCPSQQNLHSFKN